MTRRAKFNCCQAYDKRLESVGATQEEVEAQKVKHTGCDVHVKVLLFLGWIMMPKALL